MLSLKVRRRKINGGVAGVAKRIKALDNKSVDVGLLKNAPKYPSGPPGFGQSVSQIAYKNARSPEPHVPRRDFLTAFLLLAKKGYKTPVSEMLKLAISRAVDSAKAFRNLGLRGVRDMRSIIERWSSPPNAAYTIKKKGFNDPLIHTRHMYKSVNYRVNK